jgi:ribose transport system permease protein
LSQEVPDSAEIRSARAGTIQRFAADYAVVIFGLLLFVGFSIGLPNLFPTADNWRAITGGQAIIGVAGLAVLLPLSAGEFDLSIGGVIGITSVFTAWAGAHGIGFPTSLFIALGIGATVGTLNAVLVVKVGISAFIATLAIATILAGANLFLTNGAVLFSGIPSSLKTFGQANVLGVPVIFWYFLGLAVVMWTLLEHTPYGRYVQATGFGRQAARLIGVRTDWYLGSTFVIGAVLCAFAGTMQTGRVASATPTIGPEFLLPAYAAAFLGASTINRGRFNVWGTVVGVLLLAMGESGLNLLGAPFWMTDVFDGCALLLAVAFSVTMSRRLAQRLSGSE